MILNYSVLENLDFLYMEPISWINQYPAGIMIVDSEGNVKVPPSNAHQSVVRTAQKRGLDLINTGSTHKLKPLNLEAFTNFTSLLKVPGRESRLVILIIILLAIALFLRGKVCIGLLLTGASVLWKKIYILLI